MKKIIIRRGIIIAEISDQNNEDIDNVHDDNKEDVIKNIKNLINKKHE